MKEWRPTFEIDLAIRDHKGNPTGRRKTLSTPFADKLSDFFLRNQGPPKRKKAKPATADEAAKVLSTDESLTKMYQEQEKRLEELEKKEENGSENTASI